MKKTLLVISMLGALAGTSITANAADSVDLKVTGTLTMGSCTPNLAENGVVDYGKININSLNAATDNVMSEKDSTLTISCQTAQKVYLTESDDRADSKAKDVNINGEPTSQFFGMGFADANSTIPIGSYSVIAKGVTLDGSAGSLLASSIGGSWSLVNQDVPFEPDMSAGVGRLSFSNDGSNAPSAFTEATVPLQILSTIEDTNTLNITDDTPIDGQATITLNYI
ncbi:DUF1120 domain-containing protein [Kluyvera sichuanensis]|uniref:DUF1120 domain-containing protein n=1 Tax=Kluyvera sichuanensis TaxID=2725494 RepID=UPI0039F5DA8E